MGGFPSSCYEKSYVVLIYSYNDTEVSELSSHLQENNVSIIFSAMKNVSCALAFVFVQWQQAASWPTMVSNVEKYLLQLPNL